jgi:heat shock protein HtpX
VEGVAGTPPLLVYNRIDANRRRTRLLLASFVVILLPLVSGVAAFIFPFIHTMFASVWSGAFTTMDHTSLLRLYAGFFLVAMVIAVLLVVATVDALISSYGSSYVLRLADARPVDPERDADLVHLVENLCIGAGLPPPLIHVIESGAPNAFATGLSPADASLVVTRGLLQLLDRRELEGVIAHELSHIGNHDVRLSTSLAALISTVSLPLRILSAPLRIAFRLPLQAGVIVVLSVLVVVLKGDFLALVWGIMSFVIEVMQYYIPGSPYYWWSVYAKFAPLYVVFGAPAAALLIRGAVSWQREFLADADAALLTRDPEGLALALVKIGAAATERLEIAAGTVHLYFVDPRPAWIQIVLPSHASLKARIELLARMTNGIAPAAIQAARAAAARVQLAAYRPETAQPAQAPEPTGFDGVTRLYDRPEDGSRLLALLSDEVVVKLHRREGDFVEVTTADGMEGYIRRSALESDDNTSGKS